MTRKRRPPKTPMSTPVSTLAPPTAPGDPWPQLRKFTAARIGLPVSKNQWMQPVVALSE